MKKNIKITLSAMIVALSVIFMLLSFFPHLTYAIPAVTGLFMMVLVIEIGCKWAVLAYASASFLIFLLAEPESKLLYICLFGYYPILKSVIEKINKPIFEWVLKLFTFNISVILVYFILSKLFNISLEDFKALGKYGAYIFLIAGNAVFVLYDIAVSRMAAMYYNLLHPRIMKFLK